MDNSATSEVLKSVSFMKPPFIPGAFSLKVASKRVLIYPICKPTSKYVSQLSKTRKAVKEEGQTWAPPTPTLLEG